MKITHPFTSPRRHRRRRSRRERSSRGRIWLILAALAGGFALGLAVLSLGPRLINHWRESHSLQEAALQLQKDDLAGATASAHSALDASPNSVAAYRILAEASERQNKPETVTWRAQIARLQPQDVDSQLNLASAGLRFGQLEIARKALESVLPAARDLAAYNVVAGWLARAQGDEAGVERHFAAAVEKEPQNDLYQFNLASLRIKSPDLQKSDPARATLERLKGTTAYRAGSLRALLSDAVQRNDLGTADRFAQELQMSAEVTFADYLLCLDFYRRLDQKKFAALLEKVKPVAARNAEDLALLLRWMNEHEMSGEVLRWSDKLKAEETATPPAAIEIAEALIAQKNWSRLRRWTRGGAWGDAEYLRLAYQAFAARQLRQTAADAEFTSLWQSAVRAAAEKTEREIRLARLASRGNLPTEAEQLWLRVAHNPLSRREALDALFEIYRANNDLPNLFLTAQRLHEMSPNEAIVAAEYARLSLILERNISEGQRIAKEAYTQAPDEPLCALSYALSLFSQGRTADGIEVLKKVPAERLQEPHHAVYAAVLLLDEGKMEEARPFLEAAKAGPIFPEEKTLLDEMRQKADRVAAATPEPLPTSSPDAAISVSPSPIPPPPASASPSPNAH